MSDGAASDPRARPLLLLWGFMGTGKTTVGRELAREMSVDLVDLDERIAERAGRSIAAIFADDGEPAFRALEKAALTELLDRQPRSVVALGGGALLDAELRRRALNEAYVVVLTASATHIAARTHGGDRPLLKRAPKEAISRLLSERAAAYAEAHLTIDTDSLDVAEVVAALRRSWASIT
jgi:shikimate kinase